MSRRDLDIDPVLESLARPPRVKREAPPELRERALSRARAFIAARGTHAQATGNQPPALVSMPSARPRPRPRPRPRLRIALATALVVAAGAVGAAAAFRGRAAGPAAAPPPVDSPATRGRATALPSTEHPALQPPTESLTAPVARASKVTSSAPIRPTTAEDRFTAELELLQRAQMAYTRREFSSALTLIGAHARRFPRGHLAEEREALRVRCLQGAGRVSEAHRSADEFAVRFPRSVLLPSR